MATAVLPRKGIRILDKINRVVVVELPAILAELEGGHEMSWAILDLYATGDLGPTVSMPKFEERIRLASKGLKITWNELTELSSKFWDLMDILLIGSNEGEFLHRYSNDREMYESCDVVIEMVDSHFLEVFAKDDAFIKRLAAKFERIELISSDCLGRTERNWNR